jgi:hypothetical protein
MTESNINYSVEITGPAINLTTGKETDSFNKVFLFPLVYFNMAYYSRIILELGRHNFPI